MSYSFCCRRAPDVVKRTRHRFFWSDVEPVDYSVAGALHMEAVRSSKVAQNRVALRGTVTAAPENAAKNAKG